jgi:glycosyltransferase involved in cell wall biosynthesis
VTARTVAVGVVVPAHNEEELLPKALTALAVATLAARRRGLAVAVLVVADDCHDATVEVAQAHGVDVLEVRERAVGRARAAGFAVLVERLGQLPPDRLWLASTDADSQVPPQWITHQVDLADAGADLVLGTVDVDDWSGHAEHVELTWRAGYDRRDGHRHVHGANVGARADASLAVGGFDGLDTGEDVALATALRHRRVVRSGAVPVLTSARVRPRAPGGFGDHLLALTDAPASVV